MPEGLFIVIYGINNLGKSTQALLLADSFVKAGLPSQYLKYPIYDLTPTGPQINEVLRGKAGQQISEEELQALYTKNRLDYQLQLIKLISEGVNVVAEDYIGTGLAWGWSKGADLEKLIAANSALLKPDVEILLDGERFIEAKEAGHLHEGNDELMEKCRLNHLELAARFGWAVVNANQEIEEVQVDILKAIEKKIKEIK
ncbi:MAG: hypothetical protein NTZ18_00645 [Candidatus Komeilibacteria bacterium]|nr:hypothetical protein [Candidatus Komeilibacteria bacterium]